MRFPNALMVKLYTCLSTSSSEPTVFWLPALPACLLRTAQRCSQVQYISFCNAFYLWHANLACDTKKCKLQPTYILSCTHTCVVRSVIQYTLWNLHLRICIVCCVVKFCTRFLCCQSHWIAYLGSVEAERSPGKLNNVVVRRGKLDFPN